MKKNSNRRARPLLLVVVLGLVAAIAGGSRAGVDGFITVVAPPPVAPFQSSRASAPTILKSTLAPTAAPHVGGDSRRSGGDEEPRPSFAKHNGRAVSRTVTSPEPWAGPAASVADPPVRRGAISMTIPELAQEMGGLGRARLAWDAYSIGVDPALYHSDVVQLGHDDFESILEGLPSGRRHQRLGAEALERLGRTYRRHDGINGDSTKPATTDLLRIEGGVASLSHVSASFDSTTKLLLRLRDGLEVETVIIPWNGVRSTLCVSSQVGCRQGCQFCATGKMGLLRPLTSDEILAQMFFAKKLCRLNNLPPITNVVFMGMGDAADNVDSVKRACEILTTRELFQLSATKVTVSTVGPSPSSFLELAGAPCVLAWSVHAVDDALRRRLVPTTRHSMAELRDGFVEALLRRPPNFRTSMIEVVLVDGINDSVERATELAEFCRVIADSVPGSKLIVNLIPYNDIGLPNYKKPSGDRVDAFQRELWSRGVYTHVRATRGDDESAACGQLATTRRQRRDR